MVNKLNTLNAALVVFSERGFAGSAVNDIAKIANVNVSLIYYHFKDKAELWSAVKLHAANAADSKPKAIENLRDFINYAVDERIKIYENNPYITKMMIWQQIENVTKTDNTNYFSPSNWIDIVQDLQNREIINNNHDAKFYVQLIYGITNSYVYDNLNIFKNKEERIRYKELLKDAITNILKN